LRRGRDSITMADIRPGDHMLARGAVANGTFVPKNVMVIPPEQWKWMQDMSSFGGSLPGAAPDTSSKPQTQQKPPEQRN
jgi:hypothetical protein